MREGWRRVRLGDVLERVRRPIPVDVNQQYRQIGIRSHGKGIFHKEPTSGLQLGSKKVFEIRSGDLVFNIVFAWEGAVAVASETDDGRCGSHRFPTFRPVGDTCDARYLLEFFRTDEGRRILTLSSPGSAGRNRTLNLTMLMDLAVSLPSLAEQRRIVHVLAGVDSAAMAAARSAARSLSAMARSLDQLALAAAPRRALGELVTVRSGPSWKASDVVSGHQPGAIPVVGITNTPGSGDLVMNERSWVVGVPASAPLLDTSSLIMIRTNGNRDRIGNVYRATSEVVGHTVSAFQIAIRPKDPRDRDYLYWFLRSPSVQVAISDAASGSTGLGNVAVSWLRQLTVPFPDASTRAQRCEVPSALDTMERALRYDLTALNNLRSALLHDLLSGNHEIPASYDTLLEQATA